MPESIPKKVEDLVKDVKEKNPKYSTEQVWATAWSIFCKNVDNANPSCKRSPEGYLRGRGAAHTATTDVPFEIGGHPLGPGDWFINNWYWTQTSLGGKYDKGFSLSVSRFLRGDVVMSMVWPSGIGLVGAYDKRSHLTTLAVVQDGKVTKKEVVKGEADEKEITTFVRKARVASVTATIRDCHGYEWGPWLGFEGPFRYASDAVLYWDPREASYYDPTRDLHIGSETFIRLTGECPRSVPQGLSATARERMTTRLARVLTTLRPSRDFPTD